MAILMLVALLLFHIFMVNCETYDKKTIDGMVLKMLWEKVYERHDAKTKEMAIKRLRQTGDYDHLIAHLMKARKDKVKKIIGLVGEIMLTYMS